MTESILPNSRNYQGQKTVTANRKLLHRTILIECSNNYYRCASLCETDEGENQEEEEEEEEEQEQEEEEEEGGLPPRPPR